MGWYEALGRAVSLGTGSFDKARQADQEYASQKLLQDMASYDFDKRRSVDSDLRDSVMSALGAAYEAPKSTGKATAKKGTVGEYLDQLAKAEAPALRGNTVPTRSSTVPSKPMASGNVLEDASRQGITPTVALDSLRKYSDEQAALSDSHRQLANIYARNGDAQGYTQALKNWSNSNAEMAGTRATAEQTERAVMTNLGQQAQAANLDPRQYGRLRDMARDMGYEMPDQFDQRAVDAMIKQGMDTATTGQLDKAGAQLEVQMRIAQMEANSAEMNRRLQYKLAMMSREGASPFSKESMAAFTKYQTGDLSGYERDTLGMALKTAGMEAEGDNNPTVQYARKLYRNRMLQKAMGQISSGEPDATFNPEDTAAEVASEMRGDATLQKSMDFGLFGGNAKRSMAADAETTPLPKGLSSSLQMHEDGSVTATLTNKQGQTRSFKFKSPQDYNAAMAEFSGAQGAAPAAPPGGDVITLDTPQGQRVLSFRTLPGGKTEVTVQQEGYAPQVQVLPTKEVNAWKKKEGWQ